MDELGSYPRMQYHDTSKQFSQNPDQHGSWFNLAISGLKFLISNQSNNNINHNLNNSAQSSTNNNPKLHADHKNKRKIHLLGPSVFKKQLYDIPEYQSMQLKTNNNTKILTQQALKQFNGNFSNYWNQRSSLHSHHSSAHSESSAGGSYTSQPNTNTPQTNTDIGGSIYQQIEEYNPTMTSSQIIHPTQDKPRHNGLRRSRSYPLLHSAEYIHNFEQFSRDIMLPNGDIPSPPPMSSTPENNSMNLLNIKSVTALKSWDSIKSNKSIKSIHSSIKSSDSNDINATVDNDNVIFIDNHFIKEKKLALQKQRQWLKNNINKNMVDQSNKSSNGNSSDIVNVDWSDCNNETIKVISCPLPKSNKKNKNKRKRIGKNINNYNANDDENAHFSDWSNVSSNIGITMPQTPH